SAPRQPAAGPAAGLPRSVRPQASFPLHTEDGHIGVPISKPTPAPQWPLPGPIATPSPIASEQFHSPHGASPPQRPPRPSRVPSILDASKVQDHTPVFQYTPRESADQDSLMVPETPLGASRPSTLSSVGSIPDFPLPIQTPSGAPRRSVGLGPPPSARRGASTFYSNASFVSPIPEESPRSRSHTSYASSAAMPDNWGSPASPGPSPDYPEPMYGEAIMEDDAEESRLVRSASIGKRAKPTLVSGPSFRGPDPTQRDQRPEPQPVQGSSKEGAAYVQHSSSSGTLPATGRLPIGLAVTPDTMLNAYSSASAGDPSTPSPRSTPSGNSSDAAPTYSRFSAIRRPPRLDIDAVRNAEARGSLTSLPDLIRRATRLAANLEKGRRPASRFDDLEDSGSSGLDAEKHRSGLSDMLAAFPPPAHLTPNQSRRSIRGSIREQAQSWPLPLNVHRFRNTSQEAVPNSDPQTADSKPKRRCCGLPMWAFILVMAIVLILTVAAVLIPVELLVVRRQDGNQAQGDLQQCQRQLTCANGGTNVFSQGVCSCQCASGFTGPDCTVVGDMACTTFALADGSRNATVGDAIPRLVQQAQANFSIPLTANGVISKLESGNLSCSAQNALVTFDGRAIRLTQAAAPDAVNAAIVDGIFYTTITIVIAPFTTFTVGVPTTSSKTTVSTSSTISASGQSPPSPPPPSPTASSPTATSMVTTTTTMAPGSTAMPEPTFGVTEDALDFARVAVLYILQEDGLVDAEAAQMALQTLFSASVTSGSGVSVEAARSVAVGDGRSVNLVDFVVDMGG
ncbi:hypothetical protein N658DRAFT_411683, partial [Parathielavia hyrcaniae]